MCTTWHLYNGPPVSPLPWRSDFMVDLYPRRAFPDFMTSARRELMFSTPDFFFCERSADWVARQPSAVITMMSNDHQSRPCQRVSSELAVSRMCDESADTHLCHLALRHGPAVTYRGKGASPAPGNNKIRKIKLRRTPQPADNGRAGPEAPFQNRST
eukprot:scaffold14707_cov129-Isochrysis_galbana.AAC.3